MGAQPVKLYTPLGEAWINKVHQTKCTDSSNTINIHNKIIPLLKTEVEFLKEIIQFIESAHIVSPVVSHVNDKKAQLTVDLIELCIQRDLEEIIIASANIWSANNWNLDQMHKEYKARLPNFNQIASKYAIEYGLYEHDVATQFWFDGNLMYIDVNDPSWLEFARLKIDFENGNCKKVHWQKTSGSTPSLDFPAMDDYTKRAEEFQQQVEKILAEI